MRGFFHAMSNLAAGTRVPRSLRCRLWAGLLASLLAVVPAAADDAMQQALAPLQTMPVQDYGYVRSGLTFAEQHMDAIYGKPSLKGMSPIESVMRLMADSEYAHEASVLKIGHPELARRMGGKFTDAHALHDREIRQQLMQLVQQEPDKWQGAVQDLFNRAGHLQALEAEFHILPREGEWLSPAQPPAMGAMNEHDRVILRHWGDLKSAVVRSDAGAAGASATALAEAVHVAAAAAGAPVERLGYDVFYKKHRPFAKSALFYLLAALAYGGTFIVPRLRRPLAWVGWGSLAVGLVGHSVGIALRWIIGGRAPLSNMYESFVFAIAGMILIAVIFEWVSRQRLVGLGGAVLGFIFMVLAHKAPIFDSQIRPLMPALQSSWLTYHVVTIMLSYSAFALSFFVCLVYLGRLGLEKGGKGQPVLKRLPGLEALDLFNYRIIAVGFPLLTLGIVTGAVWAATAWGRPWGFDPKETWSAITWMIYAIYLHARYLAGWRGLRATILALIGFAAVLFTYFGVNYLLPGLHSYV